MLQECQNRLKTQEENVSSTDFSSRSNLEENDDQLQDEIRQLKTTLEEKNQTISQLESEQNEKIDELETSLKQSQESSAKLRKALQNLKENENSDLRKDEKVVLDRISTFSFYSFLNSCLCLNIFNFSGVACDIYKRGIVSGNIFNGGKQSLDISPSFWRDDFKTDKGFFSISQMFYYFHSQLFFYSKGKFNTFRIDKRP